MLLLAEAAKVTIGQGLLYSVIGMALIMAVLAILMGCIYALSAILKKTEEKNISLSGLLKKLFKKDATSDVATEEKAPTKDESIPAPVAPGSAGDIKLNGVPEATAAMAMAIIADELKTPVNELHFISIKEIKE